MRLRPYSTGRVASSKGRIAHFFPTAKHPTHVWRAQRYAAAQEEARGWQTHPQAASLRSAADFRWPGDWFPAARSRQRTLHCHLGPTNSGKTHAALDKLLAAERGVYCAPLRLLAGEMWQRLNAAGRPCSLRTGEYTMGPLPKDTPSPSPPKDAHSGRLEGGGEEGRLGDGVKFFPSTADSSWRDAPLLACTVEMLELDRPWDVAIIDEIQLLADEQRGWAFTQALLGVNASNVHVCGEEAALPLLERIAASLGERLFIHRYNRLSPLNIAETSLRGKLSALRPGDCVVAFSRGHIFSLKEEIEAVRKTRCAVVYGTLPMENRTGQARAFNERADGYEILVASDAVGLGLNLNIQRIVFATLKQPGGKEVMVERDSFSKSTIPSSGSTHMRPVPLSKIKQIAGRAGRFGFGTDAVGGEVTCLEEACMEELRKAMAIPLPPYERAGLQPLPAQYERLHEAFPTLSLCTLLGLTEQAGRFEDSLFTPCISPDMLLLAYSLGGAFPTLTLHQQLTLAAAPVAMRCHFNVNTFRDLVTHLALNSPCPLQFDMRQYGGARANLGIVESFYRALDLYLWLAQRFPEIFVDGLAARERQVALTAQITRLLGRLTRSRLDEAIQGATTTTTITTGGSSNNQQDTLADSDGMGRLSTIDRVIEGLSKL